MEHDPAAYGRQTAADYDEVIGDWPDTGVAVERLAELAGCGPVLEFGIGTGRLALPLLERGLAVSGIEGSAEMLDQLRAKPGGSQISVALGDFAHARVEGRFSLVVLAVNTVFALPSQEEQVECFRNAARHLAVGGLFVVEAFILSAAAAAAEGGFEVRRMGEGRVELQLSSFDAPTQRMRRLLVNLADNEVRVHTVNDRYASPAELDLMAKIAGMSLRSRWSSWAAEPLLPGSRRHVSVYQLS